MILTEAPCNPTQSRARTAELMFEAYGVPALGTPQGHLSACQARADLGSKHVCYQECC